MIEYKRYDGTEPIESINAVINISFWDVAEKKGIKFTHSKISGQELINIAGNDGAIFIACDSDNGKVVGTLTVSMVSKRSCIYNGKTAKLRFVAVLPEYSRKGIASSLLDCGERFYEKSGAGLIYVQTPEKNHAALGFYAKNGYKRMEYRRAKDGHYYIGFVRVNGVAMLKCLFNYCKEYCREKAKSILKKSKKQL